jgi:hypothetical protein
MTRLIFHMRVSSAGVTKRYREFAEFDLVPHAPSIDAQCATSNICDRTHCCMDASVASDASARHEASWQHGDTTSSSLSSALHALDKSLHSLNAGKDAFVQFKRQVADALERLRPSADVGSPTQHSAPIGLGTAASLTSQLRMRSPAYQEPAYVSPRGMTPISWYADSSASSVYEDRATTAPSETGQAAKRTDRNPSLKVVDAHAAYRESAHFNTRNIAQSQHLSPERSDSSTLPTSPALEFPVLSRPWASHTPAASILPTSHSPLQSSAPALPPRMGTDTLLQRSLAGARSSATATRESDPPRPNPHDSRLFTVRLGALEGAMSPLGAVQNVKHSSRQAAGPIHQVRVSRVEEGSSTSSEVDMPKLSEVGTRRTKVHSREGSIPRSKPNVSQRHSGVDTSTSVSPSRPYVTPVLTASRPQSTLPTKQLVDATLAERERYLVDAGVDTNPLKHFIRALQLEGDLKACKVESEGRLHAMELEGQVKEQRWLASVQAAQLSSVSEHLSEAVGAMRTCTESLVTPVAEQPPSPPQLQATQLTEPAWKSSSAVFSVVKPSPPQRSTARPSNGLTSRSREGQPQIMREKVVRHKPVGTKKVNKARQEASFTDQQMQQAMLRLHALERVRDSLQAMLTGYERPAQRPWTAHA